MTTVFANAVKKQHEGMGAAELSGQSLDVLKGMTKRKATSVRKALGATTVGDVPNAPLVRLCRSVLAASGTPCYDPGPPRDWEGVFSSAPFDAYRGHTSKRFRLEFGPVFYRGRLDGTAKVLVVGQDPATDEQICQRTFVGTSGQRLQGFLRKLGIVRAYTMTNTFLFCINGQFDKQMKDIALEKPILTYRNKVLDKIKADNPIEIVLAFGSGAWYAIDNWPGRQGLELVHLTHPAAIGAPGDWNSKIADVAQHVEPEPGQTRDVTPYGTDFVDADLAAIPRFDLSFGVSDWMGKGGGHSRRTNPNEILWTSV